MGIAHTLGKPVILIAQSEADIPFDIRHFRVLVYSLTTDGIGELERKLHAAIKLEVDRPHSLAEQVPNPPKGRPRRL
jgi:hypothetical protein